MEKSEQKMTNDKEIAKAQRKIKKFFEKLEPERLKFITPAIHQLAILEVTLNRLAKEINDNDVLEEFKQGSQQFKRENPAIKAYNMTVKNYALLFDKLANMLPQEDAKAAGEAIMSFINKPRAVNHK